MVGLCFELNFREKINFTQSPEANENTTEFHLLMYKQKLENRCKSFFESNKNMCEEAFKKALEGCQRKVPSIVNQIICLPLKIDFICNVEDLYSKNFQCDPSNVIDSKFGPEYVELKELRKKFTTPYGDVSLNYTSPQSFAGESINGISKKINAKVDKNIFYIKAFTNLVCALLIFIYFQVFYGNFNVVDKQSKY